MMSVKSKTLFTIILFSFTLNIHAAEISDILFSFSPLAKIYLKHLGLEDRNNNGVIERGRGEGYEEFTAKYGNADIGFFASGCIQYANNGKLEEPEIINHYYLHIRFNPAFERETQAIENEVKAYVYANNLPLTWLDDEQGTVMNVVNNILGAGWNERRVSEDEAVVLFNRVMTEMNIRGNNGEPSNTGYDDLPSFVLHRSGYCFEAAQFGFWFFSQLRISSIVVKAALTSNLVHGVIRLNNSNIIIDFFRTSNRYRVLPEQWVILNPLQSISEYHNALARKNTNLISAQQAAIYDKYEISYNMFLFDRYMEVINTNYRDLVSYGNSVISIIDIEKVVNSNNLFTVGYKNNYAWFLSGMLICYSYLRDIAGFNNIAGLLNRYYKDDPNLVPFIERYKW